MPALMPWQEMTIGSGLMLSAASDICVDPMLLDRQFQAAIDIVPDDQRGRYGDPQGDWTAITLLTQDW